MDDPFNYGIVMESKKMTDPSMPSISFVACQMRPNERKISS